MKSILPVNAIQDYVKLLAFVIGVFEGDHIYLPLHEAYKFTKRRFNEISFNDFKTTISSTFKLIKLGKGFRIEIPVSQCEETFQNICLKYFKSPNIDLTKFEEILDQAISKYANPITGYADLGKVIQEFVRLGLSRDVFNELLVELLKVKRGKYIVIPGGSYRVKIGSAYYGLIKVIK